MFSKESPAIYIKHDLINQLNKYSIVICIYWICIFEMFSDIPFSGQPPIKRKLLPEFDQSEKFSRSSFKSSRSSPYGNFCFSVYVSHLKDAYILSSLALHFFSCLLFYSACIFFLFWRLPCEGLQCKKWEDWSMVVVTCSFQVMTKALIELSILILNPKHALKTNSPSGIWADYSEVPAPYGRGNTTRKLQAKLRVILL